MLTKFYIPHPLLQDFVHCIMLVHVKVDEDAGDIVCTYPPTPQTSLFFYINDQIQVRTKDSDEFVEQPRTVIVGQQLTPVTLNIRKDHKAVRVGFHPGGLHRLLGIPMHQMLDDHYDAADVFGSETAFLNEQLQEAPSFDAIKNIVEAFLLARVKKLKSALPFDLAMLQLVKQHGNISIEQIASLACLSLRQFERVSKERIGLPPKVFARLSRFSKAYRLREEHPQWNWTQIAYECNYFDQMHMIRDFKEFAGVTPGTIEKELQQLPVRMQKDLRL